MYILFTKYFDYSFTGVTFREGICNLKVSFINDKGKFRSSILAAIGLGIK